MLVNILELTTYQMNVSSFSYEIEVSVSPAEEDHMGVSRLGLGVSVHKVS